MKSIQKKTLQQSSTDHTIDQNHFVNTYMEHIYYLYIIWIWTNNGAPFTLALQYLSVDTLDVSVTKRQFHECFGGEFGLPKWYYVSFYVQKIKKKLTDKIAEVI